MPKCDVCDNKATTNHKIVKLGKIYFANFCNACAYKDLFKVMKVAEAKATAK
jgi:hypothetical protein